MRSRVIRSVGVGLAAAAMTVLPVTAGLADAAYPPGEQGSSVSSSSVAPGGSITIDFTGFNAGVPVAIVVTGADGAVYYDDTVTSDGAGAVSVTLTLPADAAAGDVSVSATGASGDGTVTQTTSFAVAAGAGDDSDDGGDDAGGVADTGADVWLPLSLGVVAMGGGGVLLTAARRRADDLESTIAG